MADKQQYIEIISEIIQKQRDILGPDIALLKAREVIGLKLDKEGKVLNIVGKEDEVLQSLVSKYIELSGQIVKNILSPVFEKYPTIQIKIK